MNASKRVMAFVIAWVLIVSCLSVAAPQARATEGVTVTEATEETGATEATKETEATEATKETEATEATEETEATEATEETEATEATEETEATEATEETTVPETTEETVPMETAGVVLTEEEETVWVKGGASADKLDEDGREEIIRKLMGPATYAVGDNILVEKEPNGATNNAQRLWDDRTIQGRISSSTDFDAFIFTLNQDSLVQVMLATYDPDADVGIFLDPDSPLISATGGVSQDGVYLYEIQCFLPKGDYYLVINGSVPGEYSAYFNYSPTVDKPYKIANVVQGSRVYWKGIGTGNTYGVFRSTSKDGYYDLIAKTKSTNYLDTSVQSGKTYFYRIGMIDWHISDGNITSYGVLSDPLGITFVGTPDLTIRANRSSGVSLGWERIPNATGYAVYRKSYSGSDPWVRVKTISGGSTTTWIDTSLKSVNGTIYKYTVRALYGTTLSGCYSNGRTMVRLGSSWFTTAKRTSSTEADFTWSKNNSADGYELRFMYGSQVADTFVIGGKSNNGIIITNIPANMDFKVQVRSYKRVAGVGVFYSAWSQPRYI